ncbi:HAD-like domain-containing protein [Phakopsora pachyrhizi]|uniref:HAD-like domain-containing protein n=1 Tax=Phakopsora pachyrhizi TaxID=170000 RepID=A0AAV0ATH5_PHAPC|nr:HAD-like domain-containing protein [Phakopsora pachyrhizi]CAH7671866.1 HAD-like domain-containing protein [Phakopsora pachyrhizi]
MSEFNLCSTFSERNQAELIVDAILFDMDGTLVDSIAAVESAWGAVAKALNRDPQEVIDATHGRRAIDNLKDLKPHLRRMSNFEMEPHVEAFETEILNQADHFQNEVRSRRSSSASSKRQSRNASRRPSTVQAKADGSKPRRSSSLKHSITAEGVSDRMAALGLRPLTQAPVDSPEENNTKVNDQNPSSQTVDEDVFEDDDDDSIKTDEEEVDVSDLIDKSVRILPGVRRIIDSLPADRYAVATSGAKTYCYGALKRVGIVPPKVTITADDPRLKNGKPFPDPFILAAECLGFDPKNCVVIEDSPSGIKAGVASGAKTIAVCTSHPHEKISNSGAHWLIPTLDLVQVEVRESDGKLRIYVDATKDNVEEAHRTAVKSSAPPRLVNMNKK